MKDDIFLLCERIREASFALPCHLRHGPVEKVCENGLAHRLRRLSLPVEQPHPLRVSDAGGTLLGGFFADLFIGGRLIMALKACRAIADRHVAQLPGYLRASRIEHGSLINFGASRLETRQFALSDA